MARASNEEIARLEAMHAENPRGRVFTHLAEAYRRAGDAARARELLRRGLTEHPDYASAHVVMGRVLEDLGEAAAAERSFARVLELDPHNMIALRRLAVAADEGGRREEALAHWSALASLEPGDEDVEERIAVLSAPAVPPPEEEEEAAQHAAGALGGAAGDAVSTSPVEPRPLDDPFEEEPLRPARPLAETDGDTGLEAADGLPLLDLPTTALELTTVGVESSGDDAPLHDPGTEVVAGDDASPGEGWPELDPDLPGADVPSDLAGVETETLGDLYAAQGLHRRAAEVYRRLVERSPANLRLQTKLQEAEARVAAGEGEPVRPEWGDVAGAAAPTVPTQPQGGGGDQTASVPAPTDEEELESDAGTWQELEVPAEAVPPEPEPITFAEPDAYGAEDAVEVGAAWLDPGAVERGDDPAGDRTPPLQPQAEEPGAPWTGEEFEELFATGPADEPPTVEAWAEEDAEPGPPLEEAGGFSIPYGGTDAASPLGGPEVAETAGIAAGDREAYPTGSDAAPDAPVPELPSAFSGSEVGADLPDTLDLAPVFESAGDDDGSVGIAPAASDISGAADLPDFRDVPEAPAAPDARDALAAELAGALAGEDDGASSIRDLLRGVIGWEPAVGPATPVTPWSPERADPSADARPPAEEEPTPAATTAPPPEDASRTVPPPPAVERAPAAAPAPEPFDLEAEPWAASPSSGAGGAEPTAPILELGEADRIQPAAAVSSEPQAGPSATPGPSAESPGPGTRVRESAGGDLGDLARSLLDASVEGDSGPTAAGDEASDDEEVEVFRSWLRSLKK